jgi:hypothetical protein
MDQASQSGPRDLAGTPERLVGGGPDGNVVAMPGDPVRTEGRHHLRPFLQQDRVDPRDQFLEVDLRQTPIVVAQPFVAHRDGAVGTPRIGAFLPPPGAEGSRGHRHAG